MSQPFSTESHYFLRDPVISNYFIRPNFHLFSWLLVVDKIPLSQTFIIFMDHRWSLKPNFEERKIVNQQWQ